MFYLADLMLKKFLRFIGLVFTAILCLIIVFVLISVGPVDRTPMEAFPSYQLMMDRMNDLELDIPDATKEFSVGFGKVNITPSRPMATAGYGNRLGAPYYLVHDSIFVRSMVITNGVERAAIVSADLLIMPPTVTRILPQKLAAIGFSLDNTYLSATHSHNSIGQWSEGATQFIYGPYEDSVVNFIADGIVRSIAHAASDVTSSVIKSGSIAVPGAVENRVIDDGPEDPWMRVLEIHRSDSTTALLMTYAAHATCLSSKTLELSRDYPGMVVDMLEENGYDFAMFLAGGVGSHTSASSDHNWTCMAWMATQLTGAFFSNRDKMQFISDSSLVMARIPLELSDPQVKIAGGWKVRSWLFRSAFGEYDAYITGLRIGDVVMLGAPCDFSGEFNASLDSTAASLNLKSIVTSFNGGYIGYVTPGKYYDVHHYETQLMNWYAPGTGEYLRDCLEKLMIALSDTN